MIARMLAVVALSVVLSPTCVAASPDEIKAALEARFKLTTRSKLTARVTTPGSVMVIQKSGINADPQTKLAMKPVIIEGGEVKTAGGGGVLGGESGRALAKGDRVYVYELRVASDNVQLIYGTVGTYDFVKDGSTKSFAYKGALAFRYPDGVANTPAQQIVNDVGSWLKTEEESANSTDSTVSLGQTPAEVIRILGAPDKKVDLGAKRIFVYKDIKVVFVDGKVADVQ